MQKHEQGYDDEDDWEDYDDKCTSEDGDEETKKPYILEGKKVSRRDIHTILNFAMTTGLMCDSVRAQYKDTTERR